MFFWDRGIILFIENHHEDDIPESQGPLTCLSHGPRSACSRSEEHGHNGPAKNKLSQVFWEVSRHTIFLSEPTNRAKRIKNTLNQWPH